MSEKREQKLTGLNGLTLKWIAVVSMFLDHLGVALSGTAPFMVWKGMRIVGRLAFPLYCFLLVEGFYHTENRKNYLIRLGIFSLVSEIPFDFLLFGTPFYPAYQNVFFTLFIGLLLLCLYNRFLAHIQPVYAAMTLISMMCLGFLVQCDYGAEGILIIFLFYFFHFRPVPMVVSVSIVMVLMGGTEPFGLLAFLPILFYNGKRGGSAQKGEKKYRIQRIVFYLFYPVHLAALGILRYFLFI